MRWRLLASTALVVCGLALFVAAYFDMPLAEAAVLAPVIVVTFGAAAGIVVLWTRIIVDSLRRR